MSDLDDRAIDDLIRRAQSGEGGELLVIELADALAKLRRAGGAQAIAVALRNVRRGEERLRRTLQTLEFHINNSPMAVAEWGSDFRILSWSQGAERLFGWRADELIGNRFVGGHGLVYEDDIPAVKPQFDNLLAGELPRFTVTNRNLTKDGRILWCQWHNSAMKDDDGHVVSILSQAVDVTDRVVAEEQLRVAKDAAEAANHAKDRFIASLSHELRTPLTPAMALLSTMRDDPRLPPDLCENLQTIHRNVFTEARLIDDLLDATRLSRGEIKLDLTPLDFHHLLGQTLANLESGVSEKELNVSAELTAHRHYVRGDAHRLQQVLWNVIGNAIKFTPPRGKIWIRSDVTDGNALRLQVIDTGVGIEPEHLPRLFQHFERGEAKHRYEYTGLGLGLAIARSLLQRMGGTIWAASDGKDKGTTLTIVLPTCDPPPPRTTAGDSMVGMPAIGAAVAAELAGLRVLLVEDNRPTLQVYTRLLQTSGMRVNGASSVADAIEVIGTSGKTFNVIVSDIGLPDGTGHDLLRHLRAHGCDVPAIAVSGFGTDEDIAASQAAGFSEHLTKPLEADTLEAAIARAARR
jgi:two-component system CheB/CheR fusion protein